MEWEAERNSLLKVARKMVTTGMVIETWGNISLRLPAQEQILITPSGRDYLTMKPEDLVCVSLTGEKISGRFNPSTEKWLHLKIYLQDAEIKAIVHVHSTFACAFAVSHGVIPPILEEFAQVVGHPIETVPYAQCGTMELGDIAAKYVANRRAILLANHGLVGWGKDVDAAFRVCQVAERTAQIAIYSHILEAKPIMLPDDDITKLYNSFIAYDAQKHLL